MRRTADRHGAAREPVAQEWELVNLTNAANGTVRVRNSLLAVLGLLGLPTLVGAQPAIQPLPTSRAVVSRADLKNRRAEIDQALTSPGYSGRLKSGLRVEAELIDRRLAEGDFQTGDRLFISIVGEPAVNDTFTVTAARTVLIPAVAEFPLQGVLRSEIQPYMSQQLAKFFREPRVIAKAYIRLAVFGEIGRPGFYQLPADELLDHAIMTAGGPTNGTKIKASRVIRSGRELWSSDRLANAISSGLTLDQFNLQAGDEIRVGGSKEGFWAKARDIGYGIGGIASIFFLVRSF